MRTMYIYSLNIIQYQFDFLKEEELNIIENEVFNKNNDSKIIKDNDLLDGN